MKKIKTNINPDGDASLFTGKNKIPEIRSDHLQWNFPNMILIAGDGRNVGKTTFAQGIIRHFSKNTSVTGIKTSPHMHDINDDLEVIFKSPDIVLAEEKGHSDKDSSLLLQAGAKRVYFIMAEQEFLEEAFGIISQKLEHGIVVAESGGLNELIKPGAFFFIRNSSAEIKKQHYLAYNPTLVMNSGKDFDFEIEQIAFCDNKITLKKDQYGDI